MSLTATKTIVPVHKWVWAEMAEESSLWRNCQEAELIYSQITTAMQLCCLSFHKSTPTRAESTIRIINRTNIIQWSSQVQPKITNTANLKLSSSNCVHWTIIQVCPALTWSNNNRECNKWLWSLMLLPVISKITSNAPNILRLWLNRTCLTTDTITRKMLQIITRLLRFFTNY